MLNIVTFVEDMGTIVRDVSTEWGIQEWWSSKGKVENTTPNVACIDTKQSPIVGLTIEQYQRFIKNFTKEEGNTKKNVTPTVNMVAKLD